MTTPQSLALEYANTHGAVSPTVDTYMAGWSKGREEILADLKYVCMVTDDRYVYERCDNLIRKIETNG